LFARERATYEDLLNAQLERAMEVRPSGDAELDALIAGSETWTVP
jgi:hypothetical protein